MGFMIKGWAENALSVMESSRVCLAPIRFGAGIKGKLFDAMRTQTPSVTTTVGSEGMCAELPWPGIIADDPADFAAAAVKLYNDEKTWHCAQQNATTLLKSHFDAHRLGPQLINKITDTENNLLQHRLNNFTGAMLKHHTMMSTKYMSQWIAAKNANSDHADKHRSLK